MSGALMLALALNPAVDALQPDRLRRRGAAAAVVYRDARAPVPPAVGRADVSRSQGAAARS